MEKTPPDPNAHRRCTNCKYYEVITNLETKSQLPICRIEPPKMIAQMMLNNQVDPATGRPIQIPQWVPFSAWPIVGPNDWCGRFTQSQKPDVRSIEQRLKDATDGKG